MVSFPVDLEGFSLRLRVEAAPSVPRARRDRVEVGSGISSIFTGPSPVQSSQLVPKIFVKTLYVASTLGGIGVPGGAMLGYWTF